MTDRLTEASPDRPIARRPMRDSHRDELRDGLHRAVTICAQDGRDHPMTFSEDFNMNAKDTERANKRRERARRKLEEGPRPQPRPARETVW